MKMEVGDEGRWLDLEEIEPEQCLCKQNHMTTRHVSAHDTTCR